MSVIATTFPGNALQIERTLRFKVELWQKLINIPKERKKERKKETKTKTKQNKKQNKTKQKKKEKQNLIPNEE